MPIFVAVAGQERARLTLTVGPSLSFRLLANHVPVVPITGPVVNICVDIDAIPYRADSRFCRVRFLG